jgi:hypothetical protein
MQQRIVATCALFRFYFDTPMSIHRRVERLAGKRPDTPARVPPKENGNE